MGKPHFTQCFPPANSYALIIKDRWFPFCRADFLGRKFTIYDSQPPYIGAKASSRRTSRRFASKQISPQVPASNFEIGQLSYKFNLLKSRGPRRINCSLQHPPELGNATEDMSKARCNAEGSHVVLKNKAPRWHEHLQCWCLNFHGRVTVASVKNFQLVASVDPSQPGNVGDEEVVLLQFGKVGDDIFTMDYRQPLSAFQAFALCLTSFGTKFACEWGNCIMHLIRALCLCIYDRLMKLVTYQQFVSFLYLLFFNLYICMSREELDCHAGVVLVSSHVDLFSLTCISYQPNYIWSETADNAFPSQINNISSFWPGFTLVYRVIIGWFKNLRPT